MVPGSVIRNARQERPTFGPMCTVVLPTTRRGEPNASMTRTESVFLPPKASRLWFGIAIAIAGPLVVTPLVRTGSLSLIPGIPYVLAIVVAALVGRLAAGCIAIVTSTVLLDRFVISPSSGTGARTEQDLWAVVVFVVVALVVAELLARLEHTIRREERERDRLRLLAHAGDALAESLDVEETLRRRRRDRAGARGLVRGQLLEDGVRERWCVHPDPAKVELARELQRDSRRTRRAHRGPRGDPDRDLRAHRDDPRRDAARAGRGPRAAGDDAGAASALRDGGPAHRPRADDRRDLLDRRGDRTSATPRRICSSPRRSPTVRRSRSTPPGFRR